MAASSATPADLRAPARSDTRSTCTPAADAAAARRFGEDEKGLKIDPAICTMREGWEKVNALKAEGKKSGKKRWMKVKTSTWPDPG